MKKLILISFLLSLSVLLFAQGLLNNGAKIVITTGTYVYIDGDANGDFTNSATADGTIDIDGTLILEGDFTNNNANNVFTNVDSDGEVIFAGGSQTITTSSANMTNFINFEKLTINSGSATSLSINSAATVNGILDVEGHLFLKTPANENPTASLISGTGGAAITGTGDITVERFFKVDGRWQYISVPMDGQTSDMFTEHTTSGNFNPNLYTYDESYDEPTNPGDISYSNYDYGSAYSFYLAWEQIQAAPAGAGLGPPMNIASGTKTGYITYNEGDLNTVFTTSIPSDLNHEANYSPFVEFHSNDGNSDFYDGWNLIGNPYPCALDWNDAGWTKTNITNTVYMWDGDNGNYIYYNNTTPEDHEEGVGQTLNSDANAQYIPAMQSFIVKASDAPTFTIPASARVHSSNTMYKKGEKEEPNFSYVKLQAANNGQTDELIVRFFNEATPEIDDNFDVYKMYSTTSELPQIYSIVNEIGTDIPLAFNSLPIPDMTSTEFTSIPLGFVAKEDGTYTIRATELINLDFQNIYLVDRIDDQNYIQTDLLKTTEYTCFIEEGEIRDRFYLFFFPAEVTTNLFENEDSKSTNVQIYSNTNQIFININSLEETNGTVEIYNILGECILKSQANSTFNTYTLNQANGNYIVKYITKSNIYTEKVFILK